MAARSILFVLTAGAVIGAVGVACSSFGGASVGGGAEGGTESGSDADPQRDAGDAAPLPTDGGVPEGAVTVGSFFIDRHEVTNAEYREFLLAVGKTFTPTMPARCTGNVGYTPVGGCTDPAALAGDRPVACVDWCDAFAYCQYRGQRLCGSVGGGPVDPGVPGADQWSYACGGEMGWSYPYGNTADATRCHTDDGGAGGYPQAVESRPSCAGSVPGLFDMSGNVWEWIDQCTPPPDGGKESCTIRGGSVANPVGSATCAAFERHPLDFVKYNVGFRCCSAP